MICGKMHFMNIAIIDDMPSEIDHLSDIINNYAAENHISLEISAFSNAEDFLEDYRPFSYTLIFMDIYMEGMTGIEAAQKIRETDSDTLLVFFTSSPDHTLDAFNVHAFQYLLKTPDMDDPTFRDSVVNLLNDAILTHSDSSSRLTFYIEGSKQSISFSYIVYVQSQRNYVQIIDRSGNCHRVRMTFSEVCDVLQDDNRFLPINRGILINMDYITTFDKNICTLQGSYKLPINVRDQKSLDQIRKNYIFSKLHKRHISEDSGL